MPQYYALPNHPVKKESEDYQYLVANAEPGFENTPEYVAWRSAMLFNVGFILKLELFQKNDLPDAKMEIKAEPSKTTLKHKAYYQYPPGVYSGTPSFHQHLHDWNIKLESNNVTYRLHAEHRPKALDKGLLVTMEADSSRGEMLALGAFVLEIGLLVAFYFIGLTFWQGALGGVISAVLIYFIFTALIKREDKKIPENNEVFAFFKKYLVTNFDLTEVKKN